MNSEREYFEFVRAVCNRPKMYTPTGAFYEVVSYLEGYGACAYVKDHSFHRSSTPFRKWLARDLRAEVAIIDWVRFREEYNSDLEALNSLEHLYERYLDEADSTRGVSDKRS